jgi:carbonic anhydrase/acetyltransferase-like protein (isoleucine patch superfamily)
MRVWFGSVSGDNERLEVGGRTNIQEGAMLHADPGFPLTIRADITVGHHAILHGCTVGSITLIGMGTTILNGARTGANCLIGANALVTEGKESMTTPSSWVRQPKLCARWTSRPMSSSGDLLCNMSRIGGGSPLGFGLLGDLCPPKEGDRQE